MQAHRLVMQQPNAQAKLANRKWMVEPVFSQLKGVQGLTRFRRFGLSGVRTEFALHACAHNLRRLVAAVITNLVRFLATLFASDAQKNPTHQLHRRRLAQAPLGRVRVRVRARVRKDSYNATPSFLFALQFSPFHP